MSPLTINFSHIPYPDRKSMKEIGKFQEYIIGSTKPTTIQRSLRTENIDSCTAGVLSGGKKHFMFHAAPEFQPLKTVKSELAKQVAILRQTCDEIKGFICGGWAFDIHDKSTIMSYDLYRVIADAYDDLNIKFAMVCGKEKGAPLDNIHALSTSITMWNKDFEQLFKNKSKASSDKVLELLEENYQFVENGGKHNLNVKISE